MSERLDIDPSIGDAILQVLEKLHDRPLDLILVVAPQDDWANPSFVTSFDPSLMEHIMVQIGESIKSGEAGKPLLTGAYRKKS